MPLAIDRKNVQVLLKLIMTTQINNFKKDATLMQQTKFMFPLFAYAPVKGLARAYWRVPFPQMFFACTNLFKKPPSYINIEVVFFLSGLVLSWGPQVEG
ncbi:MAG: hypothetical protein HUU38_13870 [Anaerolineales bacterium]|nr:hypothetical protein [Anaerolineales bacterium]